MTTSHMHYVLIERCVSQRCTWRFNLPLSSLSSREKRDHSFNISLDVKGVSLTKRFSSSLGR